VTKRFVRLPPPFGGGSFERSFNASADHAAPHEQTLRMHASATCQCAEGGRLVLGAHGRGVPAAVTHPCRDPHHGLRRRQRHAVPIRELDRPVV